MFGFNLVSRVYITNTFTKKIQYTTTNTFSSRVTFPTSFYQISRRESERPTFPSSQAMALRVSTLPVAAVGRAGNYTVHGITESPGGIWDGLTIVGIVVTGVLLRRRLRSWSRHLFSGSRPHDPQHRDLRVRADRAENKGKREEWAETNRRFTKKAGQGNR
ncbi:hypothetical protein CFC21_003764 [Triticum aestivum]|uniref:Uncharacterized protein n=1 Tax=Triticum aestivum TaxID=4565 RepID=A0A3B5Y5Q2_WHEAT|nr:uncharacterized protein LOC123065781 [Triticum aestivum]KAF6985963.1 hypothetical protein CFC21_003764 [Triticum aestivum]